MILYGAGGHGKVIADIVQCAGEEEVLFIDQDPARQIEGYEVAVDVPDNRRSESVIISIGNNAMRKNLVAKLTASYGRAIHPCACVSASNVQIGEGTVVMGGAVINPFSRIGAHCIINTKSSVDHDCEIGDFAHISPGATLCGGVSVGEGTHVGSGATVIPNIKIGNWAVIGAGSIVTKNIPDFAVAVGCPARVIKFIHPL